MAQRSGAASAHPESSVRTPVPRRGSCSTPGSFQVPGSPVYPAASAVSSQPGRGVPTSAPHRRSGNTKAEAWGNALECLAAGAWCAALAATTLQYPSRAECLASWYRVAHSQGGEQSLLSAAPGCCARLIVPPNWRDQLRYAVPSLAGLVCEQRLTTYCVCKVCRCNLA